MSARGAKLEFLETKTEIFCQSCKYTAPTRLNLCGLKSNGTIRGHCPNRGAEGCTVLCLFWLTGSPVAAVVELSSSTLPNMKTPSAFDHSFCTYHQRSTFDRAIVDFPHDRENLAIGQRPSSVRPVSDFLQCSQPMK